MTPRPTFVQAPEPRRLRVTVELERRWLSWSLVTDRPAARVEHAVRAMHPTAKSIEVKES